jgi:hypothetical protein
VTKGSLLNINGDFEMQELKFAIPRLISNQIRLTAIVTAVVFVVIILILKLQ